jgi:hypothetical protein
MNEYKVECVCSRCGSHEAWFMLSERTDKDTVLTEERAHLDSVRAGGYKCNQCLGDKFLVSRISFTAED